MDGYALREKRQGQKAEKKNQRDRPGLFRHIALPLTPFAKILSQVVEENKKIEISIPSPLFP